MENKETLKQQTVSGIFWQFSERFAAELVTLIVTIVLARFLLPSDYGTIAIIEVFIAIFSVFVTTGFGSALIQKKDADALDFYSAFFASIALGCFIYLVLFCGAPLIAKFYANSALIPIVRVMGLQIPILSIKSVATAYISKKFLFRNFFYATLIGTIFSGILGISMAYMGFGPWAICVQSISNIMIDSIALAILIRKPLKFQFSINRIRKLWGFTYKMLISSIINAVYMNLKKLIIGKKYSANDLSFYTKGEQFPKMVANNITTAIESVFFPTLVQEQENIQSVLNITRRFVQLSTYLMFPVLVGLAAIANTLVPLLLTEKWNPCVIYLQIVCFVYLFNPLQVATIQPVKALGKADTYLKMEFVKKVIGIGLLLLVMNQGVLAIACITMVMTVVNWLINAIPAKKIYGYAILDQVLDFLPNFLLSMVMGVAVYGMNYLHCSSFLLIILQILTGVVVYTLLSFVTRNTSFQYIIAFMKAIKKRSR